MGLWDFFHKMATGKPVFEDPAQPPQLTAGAPLTPVNESPYTDKNGQKIIPQVTITHCKSHLNGEQMETTVWLTNVSPFELEIDTVILIDQKTPVHRRLMPGDGHEQLLYRGPQPAADTAHMAKLYYKIVENGDVFCADCMVKYHLEPNGKFTVEELRADARMIHDL